MLDFLPPGATQPLIKVRSIDDVPILTLTFHSEKQDSVVLRKTVADTTKEGQARMKELEAKLLNQVADAKREIRDRELAEKEKELADKEKEAKAKKAEDKAE